MEENKYTYENLLLALNSMDDDKKNFLLDGIKVPDLLNMINSEERYNTVMKTINQYIIGYQLCQECLQEFKTILDSELYLKNEKHTETSTDSKRSIIGWYVEK